MLNKASAFDIAAAILYGTAWKEADTQRLVTLALRQGFRGIDTANQRKHYHEAAVGQSITEALNAGLVKREELFLQTKFTFKGGQDHRLPYDATAPIAVQVSQSFASSLEHLGVAYVDSYVLHGPSRREGLGPNDWEAWRAMEALHTSGHVRFLGISNVSFAQLQLLCQQAKILPRFVQNRCYAAQGWDRLVRTFCAERGMVYQGFSLLTANRAVWTSPKLKRVADSHGQTPAQMIFSFARGVGMLPLTGTSDAQHMREDLSAVQFQLSQAEVQEIEAGLTTG